MDKSTAMNLLKNTYVPYVLIDGTEVQLTLAFYLLKLLEGKKPDLADRYYKLSSKKEMRDLDMVTILYTAYCCANLDKEEMLDEETFMILLGCDRLSMRSLMNQLMGAKKKPGSVTHS